MPRLMLAAAAATVGAEDVRRFSAGCDGSSPGAADEILKTEHVTVEDYISVKRKFLLSKPEGVLADATSPAALLVSVHGQGGTASGQQSGHEFTALGSRHNFLSAYPQGMSDGNQGSGWNCGTAGNDATCRAGGATPDTVDCYESCSELGRCGKCNWSTCFDDVLFMKTMLQKLAKQYCIDLTRIYIHGESNGAMLTHYLVQEMPDTFAAAVPWFGHPLLSYGIGSRAQMLRQPEQFRQTAMLQLHARSDTTIPIAGGEQDDGWLYESLASVQSAWSAVHGCQELPQAMKTPWHRGSKNFLCYEFLDCVSGRRVGKCLYDGVHGDWPQRDVGDNVTVWFMTQFNRTDPAPFFAKMDSAII